LDGAVREGLEEAVVGRRGAAEFAVGPNALRCLIISHDSVLLKRPEESGGVAVEFGPDPVVIADVIDGDELLLGTRGGILMAMDDIEEFRRPPNRVGIPGMAGSGIRPIGEMAMCLRIRGDVWEEQIKRCRDLSGSESG
jgi:hypothetical protein